MPMHLMDGREWVELVAEQMLLYSQTRIDPNEGEGLTVEACRSRLQPIHHTTIDRVVMLKVRLTDRTEGGLEIRSQVVSP